MDNARRTIIQGEILALLHDIGKLSWPFIECGISPDAEMQKKASDAHTNTFMDEKERVPQVVLWKKLAKGWLSAIPGTPVDVLGALTGMHHGNVKRYSAAYAAMPKKQGIYPHVLPLIMYADTADSLFSKGSESTNENIQKEQNLHLASPLGAHEAAISQQSVADEAGKLAEAITVWAEGIEEWSDDTLVQRRDALIKLLREHGSSQLAETRLPDNDVTLFQHSYSVASIFKALLAGCILQGNWDELLDEGELIHARQRLSLLAVQWNEEAFLARSMRSFEITGRREAIKDFAGKIKKCVEEELALGNEIYRDNKGICFMVPSLGGGTSGALAAAMDSLKASLETMSNDVPINGTLPWKVMHKESGLVLTTLHDFWNAPFDDAANLIAFGPAAPAWMEKWKGGDRQICPRCGLHSLDFSNNRTGGDADKACNACKKLISLGEQHTHHAGTVKDIWEKGEGRLALIQVVLPQDVLCSGFVFRGTLNGRARDWGRYRADALRHWKACRDAKDADRNDEARAFFLELCGMKDGKSMNEKDGWCSHEPDGSGSAVYVRAYLETMVPELRGGARLASPEQEADAILWWALSQTPAPSRMARLWEKMREFTAFEPEGFFVPLTRDLSSFQLLVRAEDAMATLQAVTARYEAHFAHVRHLLPLHLSTTVFKNKSPLYLAMDAARRFRRLSERKVELWTLESRQEARLTWLTPSGCKVVWDGMGGDPFRGWFVEEGGTPVHVSALEKGRRYEVRPSTFDYEVLDAFARRYDINYGEDGQRAHYMSRSARPRPYSLEILRDWPKWEKLFIDSDSGKHQRKIAVELLARLHLDWDDCQSEVFRGMAKDIMNVTVDEEFASSLHESACDGSFFDICEWYDFIGKTGGK